jgi:hypothetical protein
MVDQLVMGAPIRLLKKEENWYLIQTPYRYIAWLDAGAFVRLNEQGVAVWKSGLLQRFEENYGTIRTQPNSTAMPVADIVMGSVVKKAGGDAKWTRVLLPDGREGFYRRRVCAIIPILSIRASRNEKISLPCPSALPACPICGAAILPRASIAPAIRKPCSS